MSTEALCDLPYLLQSPYQCTYGPPSVTAQDEEGRSFRLAALGRAARRRDIPTLAHQHDAEQAGAVEDEVSAEGERRHCSWAC
jgi:hypothetical protein